MTSEILRNEECNPNLLKKKGLELLDAGKTNEAVECFSKGLVYAPFDSLMRFWRGRKLIGREEYTQSASDLKLAALENPEDWECWYYLGVACYLSGMYEEAKVAHANSKTLMKKYGVNALPATTDWYWMICMKENVYEISNAGQLYWFAGLVNGTLDGVKQNTLANAILTANITVNENLLDSLQYDEEDNVSNGSDFITWTPIADWMGNRTTQYSGTFDGNNKTVSGLYFNGDSTCIGLFGSSESDGNIKNVGVVDSYFKGNDHVGGVCGNNAGTITNCYNAGNLTAIESSATIGGICGYNNGGTVTNCYNTGTVTATGSVASVGGVCGCSTAPISNCYNIGTVTATSSGADISGICGYNFGPIKNCYYLADTEDENGGKTTEQFASGEVAYLLSQGCSTGVGDDAETYDGSIWGQKLGENGDTYPVLDITKRVYR